MRKIAVMIIFITFAICVYAKIINVRVYEQASNEPIPFGSVRVVYPDTVIGGVTNIDGLYKFSPKSFPLTLNISCVGMDKYVYTISQMPDSIINIPLSIGATALNEVTVTGRLTTLIDNGLSYNMAANGRAQNENMLQSLSYVPLVNVEPDGSISVQGSSAFSLYLNGRPYEMAQTAPKAFLQSLPASSIAKVEVITNPRNKFGADAQQYILNIVFKQPTLDGYTVNLGGGGNTQPSANGSFLSMVKKGNIDASLTYDYYLNGQRNQPSDVTLTEKNLKGETTNIWNTDTKGNGYWNTHTLRGMLKWGIDSLNTVYADAHALIDRTDLSNNSIQTQLGATASKSVIALNNVSDYTSGAAEANVIYRNYFRDDTQTERITAGYHYTYNPDIRHFRQSRSIDGTKYPEYLQRTDGGLNAHSGIFSYLLRGSNSQSIRFTASDVYRQGHTSSMYGYADESQIPGNGMRYDNNIAMLKGTYSGMIGRIYSTITAEGSYDRFSMKLPQSPELNYSRNNFYFTPSASFYWQANSDNSLILDYTTSLKRPGIDMLNPFESQLNDYSMSRGNPDLKAQYNHNLGLTWYMTKIKNVTLVSSLEYSHQKDVILSDYQIDNNRIIYTYSNFGMADQAGLTINLRYRPTHWLSLQLNGSAGHRWLNAGNQSLSQNDWLYRVAPRINCYLPSNFRVGGQLGYYKNLPDPLTEKSSLTMYSFYASKSFMSGRLNLTLTANTPFLKYTHSWTKTTMPTMIREQNNYITARAFGISLSYAFSGGKQVNVERDRTLESTDQNTGVK